MDREGLRKEILAGIDRALGLPRWIVSDEARRVLRSQQQFWSADDGTDLEELLVIYDQQSSDSDLTILTVGGRILFLEKAVAELQGMLAKIIDQVG